MSDAEREFAADDEHQVTPLELFFDLVFVFAITQVTSLLADDPSWGGVLRGMLVLAALWWAWTGYAWLTSAMDVDEGGVRLAMLASVGAMLVVALAVPGAFGDDAVLFGLAYLLVRLLHLILSAIISRDDPDRRDALLRFVPTAILGPSLLVLAAFLEGDLRIVVWVLALAIDYLGPTVIGVGRGWRVAPEHFAERHGLIVLIALGESIIAIGVGAGFELNTGVIVAAMLGIVVVSALWWLYFDVAAIVARRRLMEATGLELHRLALHAYSYLHLPMVAGVVLFALGLKTTLDDVDATPGTVPAVALCGGAALYLLGLIAYLFRATRYLFRRRTVGAIVLLALIPAAVAIPALAALALVGAVCSLVVAYEAIRYRADRIVLRHPELAAVFVLCLLVAGCGDGGASPRKPDLLAFGVAPDYDEIAYDIVAVPPDGRGRRILTRGAPGDAHHPFWSPDGRYIAFDLTESVPPESSLHVMKADGTDRRRLVSKRDGYSHAVGWSPDGKDILYVLTQPYKTSAPLWAIGVDGTGKRRLVASPTSDAAWSPDGGTIAFVSGQGAGESSIHLLDLREGRSKPFVRGGGSPRWTPDSARIVFTREFQGKRSGIYVVELDGGAPRLLTRLGGGQDPYLGEVSPDGSSVLVGYLPGITRISLADGELQHLTRRGNEWGPAWSPDGKRIAFERNGNIWLMDADGRNQHLIAQPPRFAVYDKPHWRPSG